MKKNTKKIVALQSDNLNSNYRCGAEWKGKMKKDKNSITAASQRQSFLTKQDVKLIRTGRLCSLSDFETLEAQEIIISFTKFKSPLRQNSCRLKFLKKIKFEIRDENLYKVF